MLAVANQGQPKTMARQAYLRLKALGMPVVLKDRDAITQALTYRTVDPDTAATLPWSSGKNSAPALQGQLKCCFSFELPSAEGQVVGLADLQVPVEAASGIAIARGNGFALVLKETGSVVGWGSGAAAASYASSDVVAIAAGRYHSLALKSDCTGVAWGIADRPERQAEGQVVHGVAPRREVGRDRRVQRLRPRPGALQHRRLVPGAL